jgi:hypothetical protein
MVRSVATDTPALRATRLAVAAGDDDVSTDDADALDAASRSRPRSLQQTVACVFA